MKEYKDGLIKKAENLITVGFPEKIVRLNELLETRMFANRNLNDVHQVNIDIYSIEILIFLSASLTHQILWFQALNIPVPEAITENHVNDFEAVPSKRQRIDGNAKSTTESLTGPSGTKVLALPSGTVTCNKPICDLITVVKPFIRELVEDSNLLKMWISFMSNFNESP